MQEASFGPNVAALVGPLEEIRFNNDTKREIARNEFWECG
jgi:hypothetical protein